MSRTGSGFVSLSLSLALMLPLSACALDDTSAADLPPVTTTESALTFGSIGTSIQIVSSGLCLSGQTGANPMWVTQQACVSGQQIWFVAVPAPDPSYYEIRAQGRCLDVPGNNTGVGVHLQLYPCTGNNNQQFQLRRQTTGAWEIRPKLASSLCLDIANNDAVPGRALQQFTCHGGNNQRFLTRPKLAEENFDSGCDSADRLRVSWSFTWGGGSTTVDVNRNEVWHNSANQVRWWCGSTTGSPDEIVSCPSNTNTVEVSRIDPSRIRARCYL